MSNCAASFELVVAALDTRTIQDALARIIEHAGLSTTTVNTRIGVFSEKATLCSGVIIVWSARVSIEWET